jgi:pilus assembly protein Flp/PilA
MSHLLSVLSFLAARIEREDDGATAVEYGLLVAFIAVAIIAAVVLLGTRLSAIYCDVVTAMGGTCT